MKAEHILILGIITISFLTIGIASAFLETRALPNTLPLPDGRVVGSLSESGIYNFSNLSDSLSDSQLNTLYYKVIVPDDVGDQWNLSVDFAESKPYRLLKPVDNPVSRIVIVSIAQPDYAWLCCNISRGDRLYTADATNDSTLRGTLTNLFDINYKTRVYEAGSWSNQFIGASKKPAVYNRRAALHLDGTQIGYAAETRNVSVTGVPELMKVFLI